MRIIFYLLYNPNDDATNWEYDAADRITTVTSSLGSKTTFEYNTMDQLSKMKDALGNTTEFEYDILGNNLQTKDAKGNIRGTRGQVPCPFLTLSYHMLVNDDYMI